MGSFEINSAELGTIISQYQRIGRDLSNYSGRIRREVQRLNSQKGFGIETVRNNLTHLSSNSNAHSRDAYIFGGFLKDLETESTNAESQVSKGMYNAAPTKMSLTQLVAGALAILVGFVFSKPLIAPIAAWLAAIIKNAPGCKFPEGLPTPGLTPKPVFPDSKPSTDEGSTAKPIPVPVPIPIPTPAPKPKPKPSVDPSTGGVTEEPTPAKPETSAPEPAIDPNAGNGNDTIILNDGSEIHVDDLKEGMQISRDGSVYGDYNRGQCTWFAKGRVNEITGKKPEMDRQYSNYTDPDTGTKWLNGNTYHTDTANGGCISNGRSVDFRNAEIPKRGAVMSWSNPSPFGHVAVVEKVVPLGNGEYEILFSEANFDNDIYNENTATDGTVRSMKLSDFKNDSTFIDFTELL